MDNNDYVLWYMPTVENAIILNDVSVSYEDLFCSHIICKHFALLKQLIFETNHQNQIMHAVKQDIVVHVHR